MQSRPRHILPSWARSVPRTGSPHRCEHAMEIYSARHGCSRQRPTGIDRIAFGPHRAYFDETRMGLPTVDDAPFQILHQLHVGGLIEICVFARFLLSYSLLSRDVVSGDSIQTTTRGRTTVLRVLCKGNDTFRSISRKRESVGDSIERFDANGTSQSHRAPFR